MTPVYEPICEHCNDDGVERLATEERFGTLLCLEHATAYDDREPSDPDLSGPTRREQHAHQAAERWKTR